MAYYKVVIDNTIVDAGCSFLKWVERNCFFMACEVDEAQFVQSSSGTIIWRDSWMNRIPDGVPEYEIASIVIIDEKEYLGIKEDLDKGLNLEIEINEPQTVEPEMDSEEPVDEPQKASVISDEQIRVILAKLSYGNIDERISALESTVKGINDESHKDNTVDESVSEETEETIASARRKQIDAMNSACNSTITNGFNVEFPTGRTLRFDFTLEDQSNITGLMIQVAGGATECDYFCSNGKCVVLTADEINYLGSFAIVWKSYHIAYYHCLVTWITALRSIKTITAVRYGSVIPEKYRSVALVKYATIMGVNTYAQAAN